MNVSSGPLLPRMLDLVSAVHDPRPWVRSRPCRPLPKGAATGRGQSSLIKSRPFAHSISSLVYGGKNTYTPDKRKEQ